MANLWFISSNIWRPCWFSIFGGRWEYFTVLFEILIEENVGIDTQTKSLDSLTRQIFVIGWFHLISTIIRSITQNSMDKKLLEILTVEIVGIDTITKHLESLIRNIFVIEWFHLISMLIRSITQNAMDKKFSIRQFPSPEHPCIAFLQTNLAVLDISRFTFCKVDYNSLHTQTMASAIFFESRSTILATIQHNWQCISWLIIDSTK